MLKRRPDSSGRPPVRTRRTPGGSSDSWVTPQVVDLLETIVSLKSGDEAERFFRDLCTIPELQTLAARWEVVRLLDQGVHYAEIAERTGAPLGTVKTRMLAGMRRMRGLLDEVSDSSTEGVWP